MPLNRASYRLGLHFHARPIQSSSKQEAPSHDGTALRQPGALPFPLHTVSGFGCPNPGGRATLPINQRTNTEWENIPRNVQYEACVLHVLPPTP